MSSASPADTPANAPASPPIGGHPSTISPVFVAINDPLHPIVMFDGHCNLCNGAVQWIIRRDRKARFRFASLQSSFARAALYDERSLPDSVVLMHKGTIRTRSAAAIGIARFLGFPWSLAAVFWIIPWPIRDLIYVWVAKNRYRWFGKRESCMVPTKELRARFFE